MINFLNLEYFPIATEELNLTCAARKLYISQQSLSSHASNLEKKFGVILFSRTSPLTLAYAGKALGTRARELLNLQDETCKEASDIKDFSTERLSAEVPHTHGKVTLLEVLPTYQSQFPDIEFHLAERDSNQLAPGLLHGNIDLMIDLLPFTAENVETVPVCNEGILIVVPDKTLKKTYPGQIEKIREKLRAAFDIRLLEYRPFILFKKGSHMCTIADGIFGDAQMSPRIVLRTEDIKTMLALSGKGIGITLCPRIFIPLDPAFHSHRSAVLEQNHLNLYPLSHTRAHGILGIGHHKGRYMSWTAHEFIRIAKERLDHAS